MTRAIIYAITDQGGIVPFKEFRDSEPLTTFVWTKIISKYREIKNISGKEAVVVDAYEVARIIKANEIDLGLAELAVVALTFERVIVKRQHFLTLATLIDQFIQQHRDARKTDLVLQAMTLRDLYRQQDIIGACWYHGVADNHWQRSGSVNIYKDLDHWYMFVDGFVPPVHSKREKRMVRISISYDIDDDIIQDLLASLAEQYKQITLNRLSSADKQIRVDGSKIDKRMILVS